MSTVHHLPMGDREVLLQKLAHALAARADVAFAYAYGSFLGMDAFRDIDLAVWTEATAGDRIDLELAVELSRTVGYPVDVRTINQAPVTFLFHALRGRLLTVRDERLLADAIERTARAYHDLAPLVRLATREVFSA